MKRTKYQQVMDETHCPIELIQQLQLQSKQVNHVAEVNHISEVGQVSKAYHITEMNEGYIYLHKKKPFRRYALKAAVFIVIFIPTILLINSIYKNSNNDNPIPSIQDNSVYSDYNHPDNNYYNDTREDNHLSNENQEATELGTADDESELNQQEINSFLTKFYSDFQWTMNVKDDGSYYELWNTNNDIKITITPNQDIALVEHNGMSLELSLPYGFIPTAGSGMTAIYLHDTIGDGDNQLVVISSVTGTRHTTWNLDVYDLNTMTRIPIKEDVAWLATQIELDVLSYYDEHLTYTLKLPDNTTYLMSAYLGIVGEYEDNLKYDPLSVLSNGVNEVSDYKILEGDLSWQVSYEINKDVPGIKITYSITPDVIRGTLYCGQIVTDYVFDGEQFMLDRDSARYLLPNFNINELVVDEKEYECSINSDTPYKFTTWYLSGRDQSSNRLLIQLMKKGNEDPWVIDATILTNGTKISLKQLQNKTNIHVLWSQTGDSMVISYQYEQPSKAYDNETFFVYDISENKVVYEDALTFESMEEAFYKQGINFIANPTWGEASESFKIIDVNEEDKLLAVEYSFIDQNKYKRKGSFMYNYETGEYMSLVKNYKE